MTITLEQMVQPFFQFGPHYHTLTVFADDVQELLFWKETLQCPKEILPHEKPTQFYFGKCLLTLSPLRGFLRMTRVENHCIPTIFISPEERYALVSATVEGAKKLKGEIWEIGAIFSAFDGDKIGETNARRCLTLQWSQGLKRWHFYDQGLNRWIKQQLSSFYQEVSG